MGPMTVVVQTVTGPGWWVWYLTGWAFCAWMAELALRQRGRWIGVLAPTVIVSMFWPLIVIGAFIPAWWLGERFFVMRHDVAATIPGEDDDCDDCRMRRVERGESVVREP